MTLCLGTILLEIFYLANNTHGTPLIVPLIGWSEGSPKGVVTVSTFTSHSSGIL